VSGIGTVGKYELLKQLAVGGMAEIYLARQTGPEGFSKLVVIKRILPGLVAQERFIDMFLDEARVAASFNHPNIVQIFDLNRENDNFFIAMEYIHGEDMKTVVRRCAQLHQRIPIEHVVKIMSGVLDGLHYAHHQVNLDGNRVGIVHRDISPHNIIVSFEGAIKIVDFGIAKARNEISTTLPGRVKGKHAFMSPEQVRGEELDGRSDVFAVGIVMYELLTWSRLFKRKQNIETLKAVTEAPVRRPSRLNPRISPELERIVLKALDRNLSSRYQSAQEMQMDLEEYLHNSGLRSNPILMTKFMVELFADKLEAREKALNAAHVRNLEGAVLAPDSSRSPDLVAFLDHFFPDAGKKKNKMAIDSHQMDSTPVTMESSVPDFSETSKPQNAENSLFPTPLPRQPTPLPPLPPSSASAVDLMEALPASSLPGGSESFQDASSSYLDELDPMGTRKGKWIKILIGLILLGCLGGLLYTFKNRHQPKDVAPEFGLIRITSLPSGADVFFDGQRKTEHTPLEIDLVKPGESHRIKVTLPGLPPWESEVTLADTTKPLLVNAVLSKAAAKKARMMGKPIIAGMQGQGTGNINVGSNPEGALIFLDGVFTGKKTPTLLKGIPGGLDHVILLEMKGRAPAYERLHLDAGGSQELKMDLPAKAEMHTGRIKIRFESNPENAKISINGYPMKNKTPMAASLLGGRSSEIVLENPQTKKETSILVRPIPNVDLTVFVVLN
jgi:serine/threonine protein kinase